MHARVTSPHAIALLQLLLLLLFSHITPLLSPLLRLATGAPADDARGVGGEEASAGRYVQEGSGQEFSYPLLRRPGHRAAQGAGGAAGLAEEGDEAAGGACALLGGRGLSMKRLLGGPVHQE